MLRENVVFSDSAKYFYPQLAKMDEGKCFFSACMCDTEQREGRTKEDPFCQVSSAVRAKVWKKEGTDETDNFPSCRALVLPHFFSFRPGKKVLNFLLLLKFPPVCISGRRTKTTRQLFLPSFTARSRIYLHERSKRWREFCGHARLGQDECFWKYLCDDDDGKEIGRIIMSIMSPSPFSLKSGAPEYFQKIINFKEGIILPYSSGRSFTLWGK